MGFNHDVPNNLEGENGLVPLNQAIRDAISEKTLKEEKKLEEIYEAGKTAARQGDSLLQAYKQRMLGLSLEPLTPTTLFMVGYIDQMREESIVKEPSLDDLMETK